MTLAINTPGNGMMDGPRHELSGGDVRDVVSPSVERAELRSVDFDRDANISMDRLSGKTVP
jgi:hypothetical protein